MDGFLTLLPALFSAILLMPFTASSLVQFTNAQVECLQSDRESLIDFKNGLIDPSNRTASWTGSNCCQWSGITCHNSTGAVISLDLQSQHVFNLYDSGSDGLSGEIRPSLALLKSLRRLDLSSNAFVALHIPDFLQSLHELEYLNLANAGFHGMIPPSLGNISTLQYLNISSYSSDLQVNNLEWLSCLVSLRYLVLNGVDLSGAGSNWIKALDTSPMLTDAYLSLCNLNSSISDWSFNNLSSLSVLDLSLNSFNSEFPYCIANISSLTAIDMEESKLHGSFPLVFSEIPNLQFLGWSMLKVLDLTLMNLHGEIPEQIGNITSLTYLDLSGNKIIGSIPRSISALCELQHLDLSSNRLSGMLQILEGTDNHCHSASPLARLETLFLNNNTLAGGLPNWLGKLQNLVTLSLESNSIEGPIFPSLTTLTRLNILNLGDNKLNGTLPASLEQLTELRSLDVSFNRLHGVVSEAHFHKMKSLETLKLSSNSFIVNISSHWYPTFQLWNLGMGSCHVGPSFPLWIKSQQQRLMFLDLSNASIFGDIPPWFWDMTGGLKILNFSINQFQGQLPSPLNFTAFADVDFSFNQFEGSIPLESVNELRLITLSNNKLSGTIPENIGSVHNMGNVAYLSLSANQLTGHIPDSIGNLKHAVGIDLSYNNLTGSIPTRLGNCLYLQVLDLQKNNLSGVIPDSLGQLSHLLSLHLRDNMITGEIPGSFRNLSSLETLDLGHNGLTGELPLWMGYLMSSLKILSLRSNSFSGQLPITMSRLGSLVVLDLAMNQFNGAIPAGFRNLKSMRQKHNTFRYWRYLMSTGNYKENIIVSTKGNSWQFTKTLSFLTCIDLSNNHFQGDFPNQLTNLPGLAVLSLSGNDFKGQIPSNISELSQLSSLDLSNNKLSGSIPPSLAGLSSMGYLNLSNNNFSGRIPFSGQLATFEASAFGGNPSLCGPPLDANCSSNEGSANSGAHGNQNQIGDGEVQVDMIMCLITALGFAAGISAPFYVRAIRRSWSDAYFGFVGRTVDRLQPIGCETIKILKAFLFPKL
ncbi:Receptor-like protein EIX2 [Linum grandiflorum]